MCEPRLPPHSKRGVGLRFSPLSRLINPLGHLLAGILSSLSGDGELGPQGCTPELVLEQGVSVALASSTQIQECEGSDFTKIHTFTGR